MSHPNWNEYELLVALDLYCRTPFGRFHARNPEIIKISSLLGRTPSALARKLSNLASHDPVHQQRGVVGSTNGAKADEILMAEFLSQPEKTIQKASEAFGKLGIAGDEWDEKVSDKDELELPEGPTEKTRTVQVRVVQRFFRSAVLSSYEFKCAFCALDAPELLNASHIIPWKSDETKRADPRNGLSLCALHDRAFDRGLMSVSAQNTLLLSPKLRERTSSAMLQTAFLGLENQPLQMPLRFAPDAGALGFHREKIFRF